MLGIEEVGNSRSHEKSPNLDYLEFGILLAVRN